MLAPLPILYSSINPVAHQVCYSVQVLQNWLHFIKSHVIRLCTNLWCSLPCCTICLHGRPNNWAKDLFCHVNVLYLGQCNLKHSIEMRIRSSRGWRTPDSKNLLCGPMELTVNCHVVGLGFRVLSCKCTLNLSQTKVALSWPKLF